MSEPNSPSKQGRHSARRRRASAEGVTSNNTMRNLQKLYGIFDGSESSSTVDETVLRLDFENLFSPDAVVVTYAPAPLHSVERIQTYEEIYQMFLEYWRGKVQLELSEVNPLATSVIEYAIHISGEPIVCTATLRDGKIVSCVEKKISPFNHEQEPASTLSTNDGMHKSGARRKEEDGSMLLSDLTTVTATTTESESYGSFANDSSSTAAAMNFSNINKGTILESVQQNGGSIFINQSPDVTVVTVLTDQEKSSIELELIDLSNDGDAAVKESPLPSGDATDGENTPSLKSKISKSKRKSKDKEKSSTRKSSRRSKSKFSEKEKEKKNKEKKTRKTSTSSALSLSTSTTDSASMENDILGGNTESTTEAEENSSSNSSFDPVNSQPNLLLREKTDAQQPLMLCRVQTIREENEKSETAEDEDAAPSQPLSLWDQLEQDKAKEAASKEFKEKKMYYIDGCEPLFSTDTGTGHQHGCDFYPRYEFDPTTQKVQMWNGAEYEPFIDASSQDIGAKERREAHENFLPKLQQEITDTPTDEELIPECVAHVAKRGDARSRNGGGDNEKNLRAKIKIPPGGDPALMIILTVLSDRHRDLFKFTKLRVRGNPTVSRTLQKSLSLSRLSEDNSTGRRIQQQKNALFKSGSSRSLTTYSSGSKTLSSHRRANTESALSPVVSPRAKKPSSRRASMDTPTSRLSKSDHQTRRATMDTMAGGSRHSRNNRRNQLTRQPLTADPREGI